MKTIKPEIVKKTRNISKGTVPDSNVPAFDQMYYTFEIGENKFVLILLILSNGRLSKPSVMQNLANCQTLKQSNSIFVKNIFNPINNHLY